MIKPNWDIFKAKFSDNPQDTFEWFCYLLFCREFKRDKGIFRFKNQSAIETDPVVKDGEVIGVAGIILFDIKQVDVIHNKMSLLENQLKFYKEQLIKLRSSKYTFEEIIGESDVIRQIKREAHKAAGLDGTILLVGESGTGKELFPTPSITRAVADEDRSSV